ncbi:MAG: glycosyltransferase family 39 protein, partial [Desulfococcus multivorans]|nr:glycosyltransferase family 39 protein [Desulfococcus multivorans]
FLVRRVFNPLTAAVSLLAVATNHMFLNYTYQAGSDMPFLLLGALSLFFLFRDEEWRDIVLSAIFGLLAFLTRYNGAFIPAGAMVYFAFAGGSGKERLQRAGLWLGVFLAAGLPWFIPNWIVAGSPVKNDNYVNVMMEFYALGKGAQYENWTDALPKQFTGMGDIILYDPAYFLGHWVRNVFAHFFADMRELVGWGAGVFVILGMLLLTVIRPVKGRLLYFAFGFFYFLILALVFYNSRFSLFLLAMYIPLAVWPFTVKVHPPIMVYLFRGALAMLVAIVALNGVSSLRRVNAEIRVAPTFLKDMGRQLGTMEPDKSQKVMARKPHIAYYAGLVPVMFPEKPETVEELVAHSREHGIRYIVYTGVEAQVRPSLQSSLLDLDGEKPGLKLVFFNQFGVVYRVE